jgi:hypothetical protein
MHKTLGFILSTSRKGKQSDHRNDTNTVWNKQEVIKEIKMEV